MSEAGPKVGERINGYGVPPYHSRGTVLTTPDVSPDGKYMIRWDSGTKGVYTPAQLRQIMQDAKRG